ncbi:hypothetical protein RCC30_14130 [Pseudomonas fluorescens]|nr:hypothetical protein RCC30_14130 [Pseudomonas fluorescens]
MELPALGRCRMSNQNEGKAMTEETAQFPEEEVPDQSTPAHSTEEEQKRLKDFNKEGIPPGSC